MKTAIGIDVSKASLDACILEDEEARPRHHKFPNGVAGFADLVLWVRKNAPTGEHHYCLESTGPYSFGVAAFLADHGHRVSMENARPLKHFAKAAKQKNKTDKADAYLIALYVLRMHPTEWSLKDPKIRKIAQLRKRLSQIDKQRLAERSRLEDPYLDEFVADQIRRNIEQLAQFTAEAEERVRGLMAECDKARTIYEAVTGLRGVGPETGLLMATVAVETFVDAKDVPTFFGLNPKIHKSGKLCGQTRISKNGDGASRALLRCAANSAVRHNQVFKAFFERLTSRGLSRKRAVVAVARKLVMVAWAIARNKLQGKEVFYPGGERRGKNLRLYLPKS